MNIELFKKELKADIQRFTIALAALEGTEPSSLFQTLTIEPPTPLSGEPRHRKLSAQTRKKISTSMKANWNRGKQRMRTVSQSVKDKISASQKERWARQKEAAQVVSTAA